MAGKKIAFGAKPTTKPANIDEWVETKPESEAAIPTETEKAKMKRLTFDIPEELHKALKLYCVENGVQMADVLRKLISQHLGKNLNT